MDVRLVRYRLIANLTHNALTSPSCPEACDKYFEV